ncbi:hypothetical protein [Gracilibacillus saliphilus]|uniref:hypothetical protein n=1 Tax=Gracilibacillus saliphilus TaxID=543890 RepID=UPI0013D8DFF7|nr:hypothetical protein [Gracilibacillus saliphilus]
MINIKNSFDSGLQQQIISLHKKSVEGNKKATQDLHQLLEKERHNHSDIPLLDAFHGSTMILIARDKTNPIEKLRWSKSGLKLLDEAASAEPHNIMVRLLRGKAAYKLPEKHFHRAHTAIEDYTFLIERQIDGEGFLEIKRYWQLIYELGEVYYRIGRNKDASVCWRKLKKETQNAKFENLLQLKLESLEGKPDNEQVPNTERPLSNLIRRAVNAAEQELNNRLRSNSNSVINTP